MDKPFDWGIPFHGFTGIDIQNYKVCQLLMPFLEGPVNHIEGADYLVDRIVLDREHCRIWFYPQLNETRTKPAPADALVKNTRSRSAWPIVITSPPAPSSRRTRADPTMPAWPATQIRLPSSE